ncbi:formylmethionine deformylase [Artemisia annua]|uniref:Peptide deformylase n=1 Tax=Artemisia annua TaxID=35608 RepID=A0A2U1MRS9_ARTAN|nr:formylmethionine deformylase [Artemisia annua]
MVRWLAGGLRKKTRELPGIVQAGDPVLHEPAKEVLTEEIGSGRVQKIIDDMVMVMRTRPGVGLAAPQIGIPLKIIVLEDTKEYIAHAPEDENIAQDRRPFDLLVILNPKLKRKGNKSALFFEGCLSVDGYRAIVERYLEVEVTGLDRDGKPIKVDACGWQARILQHECDHLEGTLYVDKMVKRTFRTIDNLDLPLAKGCPKQGVR